MRRFSLCLLAFAAVFYGQGERGTLNGTVTDPSGAVVVGAAVKATNIETGVETTTPTTEAGVFRLPYLPPGKLPAGSGRAGFQKRAARQHRAVGGANADARFQA